MINDTFYAKFVEEMFLSNPVDKEEYLDRFGVAHAATGVAGEAGEIADLIKKSVYTGKRMYIDEIIKEMRDLEFYLEALRQQLHITRAEVLDANWQKLSARHGDNAIEDYYNAK